MTVYLILTSVGTDTGPFDLYSDIDAFAIPFETGVLKITLVAGYSTTVPDYAATVRVQSTDNCINYKDIVLVPADCDPFTGTAVTLTLTTTTTTTASPTTTTTTIVALTTTTTTTVASTTTTTTAVVPTTTTTTTAFVVNNNTAIIDLQAGETYDLAFVDVITETIIEVDLPSPLSGSEDTAHTATKLYQNTQGSYNAPNWDNLIRIWDITINPWTAVFDQDIIFQACADNLGRSGLGLVMKDANTIIGSFVPDAGSGYFDPWEIHEIDITIPGSVTTSRIWDLPWAASGDFYFISGDFLYVDNSGTPKLILTAEHWNIGDIFLMQFDYATGDLEISKNITSDLGGTYRRPYGLFQQGSSLYLTNTHNTLTRIYEIQLTSPWILTQIFDIIPGAAGASQIPSAMTIILDASPTTTTTTTT